MTSPKKTPPAPVPVPDVSTRGHTEVSGRKIKYCSECRLPKPKGGWDRECAKPLRPRAWMGG